MRVSEVTGSHAWVMWPLRDKLIGTLAAPGLRKPLKDMGFDGAEPPFGIIAPLLCGFGKFPSCEGLSLSICGTSS